MTTLRQAIYDARRTLRIYRRLTREGKRDEAIDLIFKLPHVFIHPDVAFGVTPLVPTFNIQCLSVDDEGGFYVIEREDHEELERVLLWAVYLGEVRRA
jgi:exopolysaccharide biosynthesis predicted pyruvyltransferase EpsI